MSADRFFTDDERRTWVGLAAVLELLPRELDAQLLGDSDLTHFDYFTLSMLSTSPERAVQMSTLASMTNATLPRLSHVISRLEKRDLVRREKSAADARATMAVITAEGRRTVLRATPGHVAFVRDRVLDALSAEQRGHLQEITAAILSRIDPDGRMLATHRDSGAS